MYNYVLSIKMEKSLFSDTVQGDQRLFRTQSQIAGKIIPKKSQKLISQNIIKKGQNWTTNVCISDLHVNKIVQNSTKNEI